MNKFMYLDFKNLKQNISKLYAIIFLPTAINVLKHYFQILYFYNFFFTALNTNAIIGEM